MKKAVTIALTLILMSLIVIPAAAESNPDNWFMFSHTKEEEPILQEIIKTLTKEPPAHWQTLPEYQYDFDKEKITYSTENIVQYYNIGGRSEIEFFTKYTTFEEVKKL